MKLLDIISKIAIVFAFVSLAFILNTLIEIDKKSTTFYELEKSKINLKNVKKIVSKVDYIITYREDKNSNIFRKYSTLLNDKEIKNIEQFLNLAKQSEFYNIEVIAYMMFDNEKVKLYHSKNYLKVASKYRVSEHLLENLSLNGIDKLQYKNLQKLQDKVYDDKEEFLEIVTDYGKLNKVGWCQKNVPALGLGKNGIKFMSFVKKDSKELLLEEDDITEIKENLTKAYLEYTKIK